MPSMWSQSSQCSCKSLLTVSSALLTVWLAISQAPIISYQILTSAYLQTLGYKPTMTTDTPIINRETQHERVHLALKYILGLIPTGATSLFPLLAKEFPHKRESIYAHTVYVKNILRVLEYAPVLRTQILGLVIDRIIQVDVSIGLFMFRLSSCSVSVLPINEMYIFCCHFIGRDSGRAGRTGGFRHRGCIRF